MSVSEAGEREIWKGMRPSVGVAIPGQINGLPVRPCLSQKHTGSVGPYSTLSKDAVVRSGSDQQVRWMCCGDRRSIKKESRLGAVI